MSHIDIHIYDSLTSAFCVQMTSNGCTASSLLDTSSSHPALPAKVYHNSPGAHAAYPVHRKCRTRPARVCADHSCAPLNCQAAQPLACRAPLSPDPLRRTRRSPPGLPSPAGVRRRCLAPALGVLRRKHLVHCVRPADMDGSAACGAQGLGRVAAKSASGQTTAADRNRKITAARLEQLPDGFPARDRRQSRPRADL